MFELKAVVNNHIVQ